MTSACATAEDPPLLIRTAADTPLGDFDVEAVMVTPSGVIRATATMRVIEPDKTKPKTTTVQKPDNGPEIKWMHRTSWDELSWTARTVGEVRVDSDQTLILLNREQRLLEKALDHNKKLTKEQIQTRAGRYLFPVACALYEQHEAAKEMTDAPSSEYITGELERLAEAVLLVIDQDSLSDGADE